MPAMTPQCLFNSVSFQMTYFQSLRVILKDSVSQVLSRNASYDSPMTYQLSHFQNDLVLKI
jgi:hypothetical protein